MLDFSEPKHLSFQCLKNQQIHSGFYSRCDARCLQDTDQNEMPRAPPLLNWSFIKVTLASLLFLFHLCLQLLFTNCSLLGWREQSAREMDMNDIINGNNSGYIHSQKLLLSAVLGTLNHLFPWCSVANNILNKVSGDNASLLDTGTSRSWQLALNGGDEISEWKEGNCCQWL